MLAELESNPPRRRLLYGIYAYTGREWDPEVDLYYYRARYYDPEIGRFISEDPINYKNGFSRYHYVLSNPANWVDPSGLTEKKPLPGGGCCHSDVTLAKERLCLDTRKIKDVAARQCVEKQCGPEGAPMTCDGPGCDMRDEQGRPMNAAGYNTGGSPNEIVICFENPGPNPNLCMSQRIAHEMFHDCRPGGPNPDKGAGWSHKEIRELAKKVPCY